MTVLVQPLGWGPLEGVVTVNHNLNVPACSDENEHQRRPKGEVVTKDLGGGATPLPLRCYF